MLDPEPGAASVAGEKLAVNPAGKPVALSDIAVLKPPETVTVTGVVADAPAFTLIVEEVADRTKFGAAGDGQSDSRACA